jgi:hypothetical protein
MTVDENNIRSFKPFKRCILNISVVLLLALSLVPIMRPRGTLLEFSSLWYHVLKHTHEEYNFEMRQYSWNETNI